MDAPAIQNVTTPDGMSIAYAIAGEGEQIVHLPFHHNHVSRRWSGPSWFRGMAEHFEVVHYDSRGQGLSTRGLTTAVTMDDYRCDLDSVIGASGFERFALVAYGGFGHVAIRYAVDHPERVTALVLICSCESFDAWSPAAHLGMAEENWELFLDLQTRKLDPEIARRVVDFQKDSASQADYLTMFRCFMGSDVSSLLGKIHIPTLFLHSLDQHWLPPVEGAQIASKIEGARIVFTDGDVEPDHLQAVPEIVRFLSGVADDRPIGPRPTGSASPESGLSKRQSEVLHLISEGKRTKEIAEALVLSERTVERHIADIYAKIGARNRAEATAYVLERAFAK